MPRTYVPKKPRIDQDNFMKACDEVLNGKMTRCAAADHYSISKTTLLRHLNTPKETKLVQGRNTELSADEEKYIVLAIQYCSDLGWPLGKDQVLDIVAEYVKSTNKKTRFKNGRPGYEWFTAFKKRHQSVLTIRKPETVTSARAKGLNQKILEEFFTLYKNVLTTNSNGLLNSPTRIFNLDETGLSTDPKLHRLFFRKGVRDAQAILPSEGKAMYTTMFCVNAAGEYLPPYVIYKAKNLHSTWITGGPPGTVYNCTKSGWMENLVFESWFIDHFIPFIQTRTKPVVLVYDGHNSHLTYRTVKAAKDNSILIICLPPHTSGALQPLDVSVFKSAKAEWRKILKNFFFESRHENVKKEHFPILLNELYKHMTAHPGNAVNGFAKSGLCPLDMSRIPKSKIMLSETMEPSDNISTDVAAEVASSSSVPVQTPSSTPAQAAHSSSTPDQIPSSCDTTMSPSTPIPVSPVTPRTALRNAVVATLKPNPSKSTLKALQQGRKGRKRIQKAIGECLTEEESMKRLKLEEEERAKKAAEKKVKKDVLATPRVKKIGKKAKAAPKKKRQIVLSSDSEEDNCPIVNSDDLSNSEEDTIVPIEVGSYYLVKIDPKGPKPLYALAKLTKVINDDFVKMQFFKTVPLEKRMKYATWGTEPEATDVTLLTKKLPLPSEIMKGGMLRYNMGIIPDQLHIK